jgi:zinc D-Ala-D-Ala dipeptidase
MIRCICALFVFTSAISSCNQPQEQVSDESEIVIPEDSTAQEEVITEELYQPAMVSPLEENMISQGLINIQQLDSSILVDLKYASEDNFMGADVYEGLSTAFLQPDVAEKLVKAQQLLKQKHPDLNLIIYDAARPFAVQQKMWDTLRVPLNEKTKYLSNPANGGSIHNYGAAVDISIADENGTALDMGTPYDFFGELAHPVKEQEMLDRGLLTEEQIINRKLLREVMKKAGFFNIQTEWWHFNSCTRDRAKELYQLIE